MEIERLEYRLIIPAKRCCNNKCCRNFQDRSNVLLQGIGHLEPSQAWNQQHPSARQSIAINSDSNPIQLSDANHEMLSSPLGSLWFVYGVSFLRVIEFPMDIIAEE